MSLLELKASDLLDRFASSDPTPGGGSAAALSGSLAAALVSMVSSMPKTRSGSEEEERRRLATSLRWAVEAGARLRALVDEDSESYDKVVAAYRLPKTSELEREARKARIAEALLGATEVPLRTALACLVVLKAAQEAAEHGNPNARSDAATAAALAWAGLVSAAENVRINAAALGDAASEALLQIDEITRDGRARLEALGLL